MQRRCQTQTSTAQTFFENVSCCIENMSETTQFTDDTVQYSDGVYQRKSQQYTNSQYGGHDYRLSILAASLRKRSREFYHRDVYDELLRDP